jgi:hypothetical protein
MKRITLLGTAVCMLLGAVAWAGGPYYPYYANLEAERKAQDAATLVRSQTREPPALLNSAVAMEDVDDDDVIEEEIGDDGLETAAFRLRRKTCGSCDSCCSGRLHLVRRPLLRHKVKAAPECAAPAYGPPPSYYAPPAPVYAPAPVFYAPQPCYAAAPTYCEPRKGVLRRICDWLTGRNKNHGYCCPTPQPYQSQLYTYFPCTDNGGCGDGYCDSCYTPYQHRGILRGRPRMFGHCNGGCCAAASPYYGPDVPVVPYQAKPELNQPVAPAPAPMPMPMPTPATNSTRMMSSPYNSAPVTYGGGEVYPPRKPMPSPLATYPVQAAPVQAMPVSNAPQGYAQPMPYPPQGYAQPVMPQGYAQPMMYPQGGYVMPSAYYPAQQPYYGPVANGYYYAPGGYSSGTYRPVYPMYPR